MKEDSKGWVWNHFNFVIAKPIEELTFLMNPTFIIVFLLSLSEVTILFVTIALLN